MHALVMETLTGFVYKKKKITEIRVLPSIPASTNNFTFDAIHTNRRDSIIVICQRRHVF